MCVGGRVGAIRKEPAVARGRRDARRGVRRDRAATRVPSRRATFGKREAAFRSIAKRQQMCQSIYPSYIHSHDIYDRSVHDDAFHLAMRCLRAARVRLLGRSMGRPRALDQMP